MQLPDTDTTTAPRRYEGGSSALVLARWNQWVRLYFPASGDVLWVDLREVGYEVVRPAPEA
jgi:hypothetical protein